MTLAIIALAFGCLAVGINVATYLVNRSTRKILEENRRNRCGICNAHPTDMGEHQRTMHPEYAP